MINKLLPKKIWSLHNPLKIWTLHNLTQREVRLLVRTFSSAEVNLCLVWRPGWDDWKKLKDEAVLSAFIIEEEVSSAPPISRKHVEVSDEDITQIQAERRAAPPIDATGRRHRRFEVHIPAEVIKGDQIFSSMTADVSESGVRFKQDLPDWVAGYFTIIFRNGDVHYEVIGALVEDQKHVKDRAEIIDTNDEESGLVAYIQWVRTLEAKGHTQIKGD